MKLFMLAWVYTSPHSWRGLPKPEAGPPVLADGPDVQKVLLCGAGIVVGYGVASPELALGGSLARSLSALTGHGVEVATVTSARLTTREAQSQLTKDDLTGAHAVVLSFGVFESLAFTPARTWGRDMANLVDFIVANSEPDTGIFILGCMPPKMSSFPPSYQRRTVTMTERYNTEIERLVESREYAHYVRFAPPIEDPEAIDGRQSYRAWADAISPNIAEFILSNSAGE
ncbi:GDSL-type esterase/lipase family protein [Salinibacterium sp. NK8237]|uniref:GDSL-type esterase/lipase family protein n=1 Tax=Salinibacterium sp. NK8237 TaxID=2792038 RepID=UPI001E5CF378|nr:GDSL-type esterase/lipase family protein [Salinibacterium sp. NK8237]